jgi:hypothetical protein
LDAISTDRLAFLHRLRRNGFVISMPTKTVARVRLEYEVKRVIAGKANHDSWRCFENIDATCIFYANSIVIIHVRKFALSALIGCA